MEKISWDPKTIINSCIKEGQVNLFRQFSNWFKWTLSLKGMSMVPESGLFILFYSVTLTIYLHKLKTKQTKKGAVMKQNIFSIRPANAFILFILWINVKNHPFSTLRKTLISLTSVLFMFLKLVSLPFLCLVKILLFNLVNFYV